MYSNLMATLHLIDFAFLTGSGWTAGVGFVGILLWLVICGCGQ